MDNKNKSITRRIIAKNIINYRKSNNLSQKDFAGLCKLQRSYIASIERSERNLTIETLEKIAKVLKISLLQLLTPKIFDNKCKINKNSI